MNDSLKYHLEIEGIRRDTNEYNDFTYSAATGRTETTFTEAGN
jgi:hypothetical protein